MAAPKENREHALDSGVRRGVGTKRSRLSDAVSRLTPPARLHFELPAGEAPFSRIDGGGGEYTPTAEAGGEAVEVQVSH